MGTLGFGRYAFSSCVAAALLVSCGGSQPPIGASGTTAYETIQAKAHGASASSGDLLYILTDYGIKLVTYPDLHLVGNIANVIGVGGICSDPNTGNVFVPQNDTVIEYAHGGTAPIATLNAPAGYTDLQGCSVDPTTGNLALTSFLGPRRPGALIVFPGAQDNPILYDNGRKGERLFGYTAYDDTGDLFVPIYTGRKSKLHIAELPVGHNKLNLIKFTPDLSVGKIQWDGTYLDIDDAHKHRGSTIYQLQILGGKITVAGTVDLLQAGRSGFWIYDGTVLQAYGKVRASGVAVADWPYPNGGKPTAILYGVVKGTNAAILDITLSIDPSRSRTHSLRDR